VVLFDSLFVRDEAVHYSVELAGRTDSGLIFLLLLPLKSEEWNPAGEPGDEPLETQIKNLLIRHMSAARKKDISVEAVVRVGNPPSELMKFLAGARMIQTIVWGGRGDLTDPKVRKRRAHWLIKMKDLIECPLVIPSVKSQTVAEVENPASDSRQFNSEE